MQQQFPPSPKTSIESPQPDAQTVEKAAKSRLHLKFRDSLTEMDSRFRGNDDQCKSNVSR